MIEIIKSKEKCSNCNVCGAINFDSELSFNKKIDMLTELWIGRSLTQKVTLCNDCLKKLSTLLKEYMDKMDIK